MSFILKNKNFITQPAPQPFASLKFVDFPTPLEGVVSDTDSITYSIEVVSSNFNNIQYHVKIVSESVFSGLENVLGNVGGNSSTGGWVNKCLMM